MANYDGEVIINTQIDDADYQQTLNGYKMGAQDLSNHIQQMTDKVKNLTDTQRAQLQSMVGKFNEQNSAYASQEAKVESLKQKWYSLYNIEKQITSVENQMKAAKDRLESGNLDVNEYMALQDKLQQLEGEYNSLIAKKKQAFGSASTEGLGATIDKEQAKLDTMGSRLSDTFNRINAKVKDYQSKSAGASSETSKFSNVMSKLGSGVLRVGSGITGLASRGLTALKNKFISAKDSAQGFASKLSGNFKTILRYAVGLGTLRRIAGYLRNALKDGITAMANADAQTKSSIESMKASINGLKASLGSALAPLIQAVAPAVNYVIGMITTAIHYVGMFISALTGKKAYKMATPINNTANAMNKNTKATNKNTKSTNKNTKATKKNTQAKKKQNKELERYLSGLDEMAIWEEKNKDIANDPKKTNTTPSTAGGSGAGGIGNATTGLQVKVDEMKIPKSIRNLADTIKGYIKKGDWKGLGTFIGQKIDYALQSINWNSINKRLEAGAKNLANFLNGIFGNKSLATTLGSTISNFLNTAINTAYKFLTTFNFKKFGSFIGNALKSAVRTFNWKKLGKTISGFINGIADTILGFWDGYDAGEFGKGLATTLTTAVKETDFKKLGKAVQETVFGVLDEGLNFLNTTNQDTDTLFKKVSDFFDGLFGEKGKNQKKFEVDALITFSTNPDWIKNKFDKINDGLKSTWKRTKDFFVKNTTQMGTQFKQAWERIRDKAVSVLGKITSAYGTFKNWIIGVFTGAVKGIAEAWSGIKKFFSDKWTAIKNVFTSVKLFFSNRFSAAWKGIKNAWSGVKKWFADRWEDIKKPFKSVGKWFKKVFGDAWDGVVSAFKTGGKIFDGFVDAVSRLFKTGVNWIIGGINTVIGKPFKFLRDAFNDFRDISILGMKPFSWIKKDLIPVPKIDKLKIPKGARGMVIPPNQEFVAMFGDQRSGRNIETPESLLRQIVSEESGAGSYEFIAQINRKTIFDQIIQEAKLRKKETGLNAFSNI